MTRTFTVLPDEAAVYAAAADRIVAAGQAALRERGRFVVALSGGSTPRLVCPLLVVPPRVQMVDWSRVEFFFGDERAVPPDDPQSNYNTAREALLDHLPGVDWAHVHRMPCEVDVEQLPAAAEQYQEEIARCLDVRAPDVPAFDLIWLGMGPDGHTASLFPGSAGLDEQERWVVAHYAPGPDAWRMTLTFPVLNAAREALFVVTGAEKSEAFRAIRAGSREHPAGRVEAATTTWLVDAAAAGEDA
ncbi:MAG TPA: 6-phosphogluconolactonase [candidate division Zixibacteria bacterium]|nr:6-phosphogluconolactonase [candidate division Zixibacteria bacterium]